METAKISLAEQAGQNSEKNRKDKVEEGFFIERYLVLMQRTLPDRSCSNTCLFQLQLLIIINNYLHNPVYPKSMGRQEKNVRNL